MLEVLERLYGGSITLQETKLPTPGPKEFWQSTFISQDGVPISGGFGSDRSTARKIAAAEFLERINVQHIKATTANHRDWGIDLIPTACGFAVGFDRQNTALRSLAEACERWVISKWIDDGFLLERQPSESIEGKLDDAALFFRSHFDEVQYFFKNLAVVVGDIGAFEISVYCSVAILENGVFVGYAAQGIDRSNSWQHALLESYRHLLIYRNNPVQPGVFPDNRIRYFATHKQMAMQQIERAKKISWPIPKVIFHKCNKIEDGNYFLARTILEGWNPWHIGGAERFLY